MASTPMPYWSKATGVGKDDGNGGVDNAGTGAEGCGRVDTANKVGEDLFGAGVEWAKRAVVGSGL